MGIEPAEGPLDLQPGRDDDAIHIDRPGPDPQRRQHARDDHRVDGLQRGDGPHREGLQPAAQCAGRRHQADLAEPTEHGIVLHEAHVAQATAAHHQQRDQQAHHCHRAEVAPRGRASKRGADHRIEARRPQVPAEQLEPGIRRERHVCEFQWQIPIDSGSQIGSASSPVRWPFVDGVKGWLAPLFNHNGRPFSISHCRHGLNFCHIRVSYPFSGPAVHFACKLRIPFRSHGLLSAHANG